MAELFCRASRVRFGRMRHVVMRVAVTAVGGIVTAVIVADGIADGMDAAMDAM